MDCIEFKQSGDYLEDEDEHRKVEKLKESYLLLKKKMILSSDLIQQYNDKLKECEQIKAELEAVKDDSNRMKHRHSVTLAKVIKLEQENTEYKKKVEKLSTTIADHETRIAGDQQHMQQLICKMEDLEDKHSEKLMNTELEKSSLEVRVKELDNELKKSKKSHETEIKMLEKKLSNSEKIVTKKKTFPAKEIKATQEKSTNTGDEPTRKSDKCILTDEFYSMKDDPYPLFCSKCLVHLDPPPINQICKQMSSCPPLITEVPSPPQSTDANKSINDPKETCTTEPLQPEKTNNSLSESVSISKFQKLEKKFRILERKLKRNTKNTANVSTCCSFQHSNNCYSGPFQNPLQPDVMFQFMNRMMALNDRQREIEVPSRKRKRERSVSRANCSRAKSKKKKRKIDGTTSTWNVEIVPDDTNDPEYPEEFTHSLPSTKTLAPEKELMSRTLNNNGLEYPEVGGEESLLRNKSNKKVLVSLADNTISQEYSAGVTNSLLSNKSNKEHEDSLVLKSSLMRNTSNMEMQSGKEQVLITGDTNSKEYSVEYSNSLLRIESNKEVLSGKELVSLTDDTNGHENSRVSTNSLMRNKSNIDVLSGKELVSLNEDTDNQEYSAASTKSFLRNKSNENVLSGKELLSCTDNTNGDEYSEASMHSLPSGRELLSPTEDASSQEYSAASKKSLLRGKSNENVFSGKELVSLADNTNSDEYSEASMHSPPSTKILSTGKELLSSIDTNGSNYGKPFTDTLKRNQSNEKVPSGKELVSLNDNTNSQEYSAAYTNSLVISKSNEKVLPGQEVVSLTEDINNQEDSTELTNFLLRYKSNKKVLPGKEIVVHTDDTNSQEYTAASTNSLLRNKSNEEVLPGQEVVSLTEGTNSQEYSNEFSLLSEKSNKKVHSAKETVVHTDVTNSQKNSAESTNSLLKNKSNEKVLPGKEVVSLTEDTNSQEYSTELPNSLLINKSYNKVLIRKELVSCNGETNSQEYSAGYKNTSQRNNSSVQSLFAEELMSLAADTNSQEYLEAFMHSGDTNPTMYSESFTDILLPNRSTPLPHDELQSSPELSCSKSNSSTSIRRKRQESNDSFVSPEISNAEDNSEAVSEKVTMPNKNEERENHGSSVSAETSDSKDHSPAHRISHVLKSQLKSGEDRDSSCKSYVKQRRKSHDDHIASQTSGSKKNPTYSRILFVKESQAESEKRMMPKEEEQRESYDNFILSETKSSEKNVATDKVFCMTKSGVEKEKRIVLNRTEQQERQDNFTPTETSELVKNSTAGRILFVKESQAGNEERTIPNGKERQEIHENFISSEGNVSERSVTTDEVFCMTKLKAGKEMKTISNGKGERESHDNCISAEINDSEKNPKTGRILFVKESQAGNEEKRNSKTIERRESHEKLISTETGDSEKNPKTAGILFVKEPQAGNEEKSLSNAKERRESYDNIISTESNDSKKNRTVDQICFVKESETDCEKRTMSNKKVIRVSHGNFIPTETNDSDRNVPVAKILDMAKLQTVNEKGTMSNEEEQLGSHASLIPTETNGSEKNVTTSKLLDMTKSQTENEKSSINSRTSSPELTCSSSDESMVTEDRNENLLKFTTGTAKRSAKRPLKKSSAPNKKRKKFISSLFDEESENSCSDLSPTKQRVQENIENKKVKAPVLPILDSNNIHIPAKKQRIAHTPRTQGNINAEGSKSEMLRRMTVTKTLNHSDSGRTSVSENSMNIRRIPEIEIGTDSAMTMIIGRQNETNKGLAIKKSKCTEKLNNVVVANEMEVESSASDFLHQKMTAATAKSENTELSKRLREGSTSAIDFDHSYHLTVPKSQIFEKVIRPAVDNHNDISSNQSNTNNGESNREKNPINHFCRPNDVIKTDNSKILRSKSISRSGAEIQVNENSILQHTNANLENSSNVAVRNPRSGQVQNVTTSSVRELRSRKVVLNLNKKGEMEHSEEPKVQKCVVRNSTEPECNPSESERFSSPIALLEEFLKTNQRRCPKRNTQSHKKAVQRYWQRKEKAISTELNRLVDDTEWSSALLWSVVEKISECPNLRIIAMSIVNFLCERAGKREKLDNTYTPPAPLMTKTQQRISTLLAVLNRTMPTIIQLVQGGIEYKLFRLSHGCLTGVAEELVRMFTVLARMQKDREKVRILCCDCLYCLGLQAMPLLYVVLTSWPEVLPIAGSNEEPLVRCILHLIMSQTVEGEYNKLIPLKNLLLNYYRYPANGYLSKQLITDFMNALKENQQRNLDTAIILLAKREKPDWAYKNVIQGGLLQIMVTNAHPSIYDAFCLLGNILRTFPVMDPNGIVNNIMNQLYDLMQSEGSADQREGAACAMMSLSRHKNNRVIEAILNWKPNKPLRPSTVQRLRPILQAHPENWWNRFRLKKCLPKTKN